MVDYKTSYGDSFYHGRVTHVDFNEKKVITESGDILDFTDVVMAVGSTGPFPGRTETGSVEEATMAYKEISDEIEKATNVTIIGGGPVGVELSGEIADKYHAKKITLIHSGDVLISSKFGDTFQKKIQSAFEAKSIDLALSN
jgi:NADH dehydrogenase FAD-containing subunit